MPGENFGKRGRRRVKFYVLDGQPPAVFLFKSKGSLMDGNVKLARGCLRGCWQRFRAMSPMARNVAITIEPRNSPRSVVPGWGLVRALEEWHESLSDWESLSTALGGHLKSGQSEE